MKSVKLLHISDLHIGKRLMEVSLLEDQKYIVDQILSIIDDERPDAVLIAGDIYDRANPNAEAMELLDELLVQLGTAQCFRDDHQWQPRLARTVVLCKAFF